MTRAIQFRVQTSWVVLQWSVGAETMTHQILVYFPAPCLEVNQYLVGHVSPLTVHYRMFALETELLLSTIRNKVWHRTKICPRQRQIDVAQSTVPPPSVCFWNGTGNGFVSATSFTAIGELTGGIIVHLHHCYRIYGIFNLSAHTSSCVLTSDAR